MADREGLVLITIVIHREGRAVGELKLQDAVSSHAGNSNGLAQQPNKRVSFADSFSLVDLLDG